LIDTMTSTFDQLSEHYAKQGGFYAAFSKKVADYVASRPDYPAALFEKLDELLGFAPSRIADVGAGTGLLTRDLLARGHEVMAIEPNQAMRDAADHLLASNPRYSSVNGSAEVTSLADHSVDMITAAQAFHWFDIPRARAEFLRILKPNGFVALIWNDRVLADPLHRAFDEIAAEFGGAKRSALVAHEERHNVPTFFGNATAQQFSWPHEHTLDETGLAALIFSRSYMPDRESAEGRRAVEAVKRVFDRLAENARVVVRYTTVAHIGRPS
jgi:SAM-dependent methyltransferase